VLLWQLLHWTPVTGTCGGIVMPLAPLPLWQLAQFVSAAVWAKVAPAHVVVLLWQSSHGSVVGTWFAGLPSAAVPLWQVAQPVVIPAWSIAVAPAKLTVLL
jgi:hypothetical protein